MPDDLAHSGEEQNEAHVEHRKGLSETERSAEDERIRQKLQARSGSAENKLSGYEGPDAGLIVLRSTYPNVGVQNQHHDPKKKTINEGNGQRC